MANNLFPDAQFGDQNEMTQLPDTAGAQAGKPQTRPKFDIYKVDYEWTDKNTNKKELRLAYEALKEDGGFPDLMKHVLKRLKQVDPKFKTIDDYNNATPEEIQAANEDVLNFLDEMDQTDKVLRGPNAVDQKAGAKKSKLSEDIFGAADDKNQRTELTDEQLELAAKIEKKRQSESERYKGNEFMRAKEYEEAIKCYGKAIDLNPDEAATYSNRAMAYLKMKVYPKVIEDANKAIELDPHYVKAYHRRGKAYLASKKYELAIPDFQFILEKNPQEKDINACLREAREMLHASEPRIAEVKDTAFTSAAEKPKAAAEATKPAEKSAAEKPAAAESKEQGKKGFRKVAIASDSDEDEEEEVPIKSSKKDEETKKEPVEEVKKGSPLI